MKTNKTLILVPFVFLVSNIIFLIWSCAHLSVKKDCQNYLLWSVSEEIIRHSWNKCGETDIKMKCVKGRIGRAPKTKYSRQTNSGNKIIFYFVETFGWNASISWSFSRRHPSLSFWWKGSLCFCAVVFFSLFLLFEDDNSEV